MQILKNYINYKKKAIRLISKAKYNAHTEPIFKGFSILKLPDLCALSELKFCYKLENKTLPSYFLSNIFKKHTEDHNYPTRGIHKYKLPSMKHSFVKKSLWFKIGYRFNTVENCIKEKVYTHSLKGFATYVKNYYLKAYSLHCNIADCYICKN